MPSQFAEDRSRSCCQPTNRTICISSCSRVSLSDWHAHDSVSASGRQSRLIGLFPSSPFEVGGASRARDTPSFPMGLFGGLVRVSSGDTIGVSSEDSMVLSPDGISGSSRMVSFGDTIGASSSSRRVRCTPALALLASTGG